MRKLLLVIGALIGIILLVGGIATFTKPHLTSGSPLSPIVLGLAILAAVGLLANVGNLRYRIPAFGSPARLKRLGAWTALMAAALAALVTFPSYEVSTQSASTGTKQAASTATPRPTEPPSTPATPEQRLTAALQAAHLFGKVDNLSVTPSSWEEGKWLVDVHLRIADNLTDGMIASGAIMDYFAICKAAYTAGVPVQWVAFTGAFPMKDRYGNTSVDDVLVLKLPAATAARINWNGLTSDDLWRITDKLIVYPAFAKELPAR